MLLKTDSFCLLYCFLHFLREKTKILQNPYRAKIGEFLLFSARVVFTFLAKPLKTLTTTASDEEDEEEEEEDGEGESEPKVCGCRQGFDFDSNLGGASFLK